MFEEDPIVLYIVIRKSLNMGAGKITAQGCHASNAIMARYFKAQLLRVKCVKCGESFPKEEEAHIKLMSEWMYDEPTIIVKVANDSKWERLKKEHRDYFVVKDAGRTEVPPNSETAMSFWPMRESSAGLIRKLPNLKKAKFDEVPEQSSASERDCE